jgi:hypothetical protein
MFGPGLLVTNCVPTCVGNIPCVSFADHVPLHERLTKHYEDTIVAQEKKRAEEIMNHLHERARPLGFTELRYTHTHTFVRERCKQDLCVYLVCWLINGSQKVGQAGWFQVIHPSRSLISLVFFF